LQIAPGIYFWHQRLNTDPISVRDNFRKSHTLLKNMNTTQNEDTVIRIKFGKVRGNAILLDSDTGISHLELFTLSTLSIIQCFKYKLK
jgi:hypothetical protein